MSLIASEQDDPEVLKAEDAAIIAAEKPQPDKPPIPLGQDLATLIETLSHDESPTHATTEG